jgi:hypothetical protein
MRSRATPVLAPRARYYDLNMAERCPRCKARGFESGPNGGPCPECGWTDPVLGPRIGSNWYSDPANPGMARYCNSHTRAWKGKPKKGQRTWAIPKEPPEQWVVATDPSQRAIASVRDCRVLGGHGLGLSKGAVVEVVFWRAALTIRMPSVVHLRKAAPRHAEVPYKDVVALEIGGFGARQTGSGFVGGGFGLEGAAEGMLIASALNLLTTRTKVTTVICLQTPSAELFLQHTTETPDARGSGSNGAEMGVRR